MKNLNMVELNRLAENVFDLAAQNKIYLILAGITILVAYAIFNMFVIHKESKIRKLKNENKVKEVKVGKKKVKIGDTTKIRLKLVRAGSPLQQFGLDEYSYYWFKIILGGISALSVLGDGFKWMLVYFIMGFSILDVYISMKKKRRHKAIKDVLTTFLGITVDGLENGQVPTDIMQTALKKISKTNPLWVELKILNNKLMKGNMKVALDEFRERVDLEEIDNYCLSLLQYEIGGRTVIMMRKQIDVLNSLKATKKKRETQAKGNLSSVAVALVVVAMLIIILMPLLASFKEMPMLKDSGSTMIQAAGIIG